MTIKEQLFDEIESTPEDLLQKTLDFLRLLKTKPTTNQINTTVTTVSHPAQSTGRSLLEHLKTIGNWEGDDLEECLEIVRTTRSQAKFDQPNPFDM
ncbi:DUF2281 domain-containing protein [Merismopedia glauca]|uniref:DUF2281 domain-containing protein n=1 Tax=Merismopedia glauca CCAP 1448/3 TaxID=1296344 RepID=A0A2T1C9K4_9CYAN|nr:DUF2281 domain-containing protein [Merismopedia glauca]PSB04936.1 DUF2281 domain-containing protein [Merismopedia glauca CCAP 1448/3]